MVTLDADEFRQCQRKSTDIGNRSNIALHELVNNPCSGIRKREE